MVTPPDTPVGVEVFDGASVVTGEAVDGAVVVVADAPDEGAFVVVVTDAIDVVVAATVVVVAAVVVVVDAAGIETATDAGDPDEMLVWFADPEYETENVAASARELVPVAPSEEMVDTAEIVQTVGEVCAIVIDTMLVRSKSTPSTAETVVQSTCPEVAVSRNWMFRVGDVADTLLRTTVGAARV